ncbi:DsrE family protein [Balneatrix alpica]|uniref:DsrE family protein n=1 Tax=Balneatrix alpica TaxID=75684 RepID=UPI0027394731|nr:hypothetical protein [Balneatrix alpica]
MWRALLLLLLSPMLSATEVAETPPRYLAELSLRSADEISSILQRAEALLEQQGSPFPDYPPITMVLHGEEVGFFTRNNYTQNKALVDLAARLDAFNVIDLRICETWMRDHGIGRGDLPAFVETIPYGPAEEEQLKAQGLSRF